MPIDHFGVRVSNFMKSRDFYIAALAPLGFSVMFEGEDGVGLAENGSLRLWIGTGEPVPKTFHLAFAAADHDAVRRFHAAATEAGGIDNGAPGIREQYSPNYYAAFVLDPDGNNIEAVCRKTG